MLGDGGERPRLEERARELGLDNLRFFSPVPKEKLAGIVGAADVTLTAGGDRIALTSSGAVSFLSAEAQATAHGVKLSFTFEHRALRLVFTRVYTCYPGSPTIETWTRITSSGGEGTSVTVICGPPRARMFSPIERKHGRS